MTTEVSGTIWHIPHTHCPRFPDELKAQATIECADRISPHPFLKPQTYHAIAGVSGRMPVLAGE